MLYFIKFNIHGFQVHELQFRINLSNLDILFYSFRISVKSHFPARKRSIIWIERFWKNA